MEIKIKIEGKRVICDVSDKKCVKRPCFAPHRYIHYGRSIAGEDCSYQDKNILAVREIIMDVLTKRFKEGGRKNGKQTKIQ